MIQIKNRFTNAVLFEGARLGGETNYRKLLGFAINKALSSGANLSCANLSCADLSDADLGGADLRGANLRCADLRGADLGGADLRGANLSDADLGGADLRGANLSCADLRDADLRDADLRGADLRCANLRCADLRGADLGGADLIPTLENIDAKILAAVEAPGNCLDMQNWHVCQTTHCRAGWAIHLCGKAGYALETKFGSSVAGALIYAKSRPNKPVPNFTASNDKALADMRACAAEASNGS
jgi:hypothetical protein